VSLKNIINVNILKDEFKNNKMKVLITGALGMLGQQLAKVYKDQDPILWDREVIDITDKDKVLTQISKIKPDIVLNTAAYNDVDGAENNEALAMEINGHAIGHLAKAVSTAGGILVHYSTDYVFKGDSVEGYKEDGQPDPQSAYARSKYLGEQELVDNIQNYYLIRLSRLFGRPAKSKSGKKSFVEIILDLANNQDEVNVIDEEVSSPTYSVDLALATKAIIDQKKSFGIYHISNNGSCTWFEFAKEIFSNYNIKVKLNPVPADFFSRPALRPKYSVLLNNKTEPLRSWQYALKDYMSVKNHEI